MIDLKEHENWLDKVKDAFFVFGVYTVYAYLFYNIVDFFIAGMSSNIQILYLNPFREPSFKETLFKNCILPPIGEELFWRVLPITILLRLSFKRELIFLIMIAVSLCFGWYHNGIISVFAQGILGILLSYLYLKANSIPLNIFTHFLWNFSLLSIFPYFK